jgi:sugar phosphate isomerase/epimerase
MLPARGLREQAPEQLTPFDCKGRRSRLVTLARGGCIVDGRNNFPKLHNAMWPGLVGKGPNSEPPIGLDEMLELTAAAEVDSIKFDGVDLFLAEPHTSIDSSSDDIKKLANKIAAKNLEVGSVVAPVWPPVGGGSAMGDEADRKRFVEMVRKACRIGKQLREFGVRNGGVVRIDSAASVEDWAKDPIGNTRTIANTFRQACDVAEDNGERLAAEGEICWGGMHSWRTMVDLLEQVDRPKTLGFQADMAHTLLTRSATMLLRRAFCRPTSTGSRERCWTRL